MFQIWRRCAPAECAEHDGFRGVQSIIHAHRVPGRPNSAGSEHHSAAGALDDGMNPPISGVPLVNQGDDGSNDANPTPTTGGKGAAAEVGT